MTALSIFDGSNVMRDAMRTYKMSATSLDIIPGHKFNKVDIITNILDFDYKAYHQDHFTFLFIALPCQAYSHASGSFHFKKSLPVTPEAINSINILIKIWQITKYFRCDFIIENPSGGLINNKIFNSFFKLNISRLPLKHFGFPTQKKTDLFYNFDMLLLTPRSYRKNGVYQAHKLDNMTKKKRSVYPEAFALYVIENYINYKTPCSHETQKPPRPRV